MSTSLTRSIAASSVTLGLVLTLAACAPAEDEVADGTVAVAGSDYGFDITGDVAVGSTLAFSNSSDVEFHEMVVMRLADDEERSLDELLALPPEEAMSAMTFVGVAGAAPEQEGRVVDGTLTIEEAGRYVLTCFLPEGADPAVAEEAFFGEEPTDGPPDLGDGTPHAMLGMVREFTVAG